EAGTVGEAYDLLRAVVRLRPRFTSAADLGGLTPAVTLREGPAGLPRLVCLSTPMVTGGLHQHSRIVSHLVTPRHVVAVPTPGFAAGERLPASVDAAVEALADIVLTAADGHPFVMLGYSSGGSLGYSVAGNRGWRTHAQRGAASADPRRAPHLLGILLCPARHCCAALRCQAAAAALGRRKRAGPDPRPLRKAALRAAPVEAEARPLLPRH